MHGARLVIVPHLLSRSPVELLELLAKEQVTVFNQTPSAFYPLIDAESQYPDIGQKLSLRYVIFGGEALELRLLIPGLSATAPPRRSSLTCMASPKPRCM